MRAMRLVIGIVACALVCGAVSARAAEVSYHSPNGFSLTVPDGWTEIPHAEIESMAAKLLRQNNNLVHDAGFQPAGQPWFMYPYALTQVIHYPTTRPPNEREMRQIVDQIAGSAANVQQSAVSPEAKQLLKNIQTSAPTFDAKKRTFVMPVSMNVPGIGQIRGVAVGHFGKSDLVQVCCYDQATNYAKQEANFAKILDSFKFDASAEYPNSVFSSNPLGMIGAIGIVVLIVAWVIKKARA
jgi:hypothetical protein